jgi:callose synthase
LIFPFVTTTTYPSLAGGDHAGRKTYDDFNEFFWSPDCLEYDHHHALTEDFHQVDEQTTIAEALQEATKTYIEKRSWLHPLHSFHRIFEWHVISFTLLATLAFRNALIWRTSFALLVGSFVFWEINFLGIIWICLEIWTIFPTTSLTGPAIYGFILRLLAGYVILLYQSVYYHWASLSDVPEEGSTRALGDANFWWWQYLWLSFFALALYFVETIVCWVPKFYSFVMTWDNDIVQILLNILYPFSQLFVGKQIHTTQSDSLTYIFFWLTLISFKLWFGYYYIIFPITIPSIEIFDDYMNFPDVSFLKAVILMSVWWFPHFMVYLIDMSIWFSVWCAAVGGFHALLDRQGAVRKANDMRAHFMRLPFALHQTMMPSDESSSSMYARTVSRVSNTSIGLPTKGGTNLNHEAAETVSHSIPLHQPQQSRAKSSNELSAYQYSTIPDSEFDSVEVSHFPSSGYQKPQSAMEDFLDIRSQRWMNFGKVWNEIISKLREGDLLSNNEKDILQFTHFNWLSKPIYLPLYQTAGRVETAVYEYKNVALSYHHKDNDPPKKILITQLFKSSFDVPTWEAVSEIWELSRWALLTLMGPAHNEDLHQVFTCLMNWAATDDIYKHFSLNGLPGIVESVSNIANSLKGTMKTRAKNPIVSSEMLAQYQSLEKKPETNQKESCGSSPTIKRSISTGFLAAIASNSPLSNNVSGAKGDEETVVGTPGRKSDSKYALLQPFRNATGLSDRVRDKLREDLRSIFNSVKESLRKGGSGQETAIAPQAQNLIDRITFILSLEKGFLWDDIYASRQIDDLAKDIRVPSLLNKMIGLIKLRQTEIEPASPEARRRLHFFVNSLFMSLPSVPSVLYSKDYTCLTPFYSEDVLLTRNDLESKNSDGVSTILYLQTLYKKDWHNFLERLNIADDQSIWSSPKHLQETRMWASMRAQTLFRTVEGMMFTESAIRLLSDLEGISENTTDILAKLKFSYVIAAQAYASMKKSGDHKADDIDFLLSRHPNLRVAYIETLRPTRTEQMAFYSVLIKHDNSDANDSSTKPPTKSTSPYKVKEVYRIKLPGNPILGEGKPENQNHALIFSRGRYLQAIDMNQAGYFEEALKMRNLLQEFDRTGCKILGFREHIFTGSVSSVANYMALQELSFVTLGQRVLTQPLRIRQHYGHPDLFDKIFVMTEGGMSKASRGINLSEDVFAGFNSTIRGHRVEFREYVQAGKGRDVGLQQTYKFEAKLSQGNAEQSISRDMNRLCTRLDFFRLLSFFYGGIGHYMANTLVMFTLVLVVYTMVITAIFNEEGVNGRAIKPEGVLQIMLAGMGILQTLPLCATLAVEKGVFEMVTEITYMILSGGPLYFIFHIQTKSFYFQQTLLAGGAMYRPTGRGFVITHSSFDENFRFFASSHIYLGIELMMALIFYGIFTSSKQYIGLTWSLWLVVISFVLGPFWFNPLSFESPKVLEDYSAWRRWMHEAGGRSEQSWSTWWKEENAYIRDLSFSWKLLLVVVKCAMWGTLGTALLGKRFFHSPHEHFRLAKIIAICIAYLVLKTLLQKFEMNVAYASRRLLHYLLTLSTAITLIYFFVKHTQNFRYTIALYYLIASANYALLIAGFNSIAIRLNQIHDLLVGHLIFGVLLIMSLLQVHHLRPIIHFSPLSIFRRLELSRHGCFTTMLCQPEL